MSCGVKGLANFFFVLAVETKELSQSLMKNFENTR